MSSNPAHAKLDGLTPAPPGAAAASISPLGGMLAELRVRHWRLGSTLVAAIGSALRALWSNRLRSFLTILGIFIGVASVIAALTLTQGANGYIDNQINSIGTLIFVHSGQASKFGVSQGAGSLSTLTLQDAQSLAHLSHVQNVSPLVMTNEQAVNGKQSWSTQVEGVDTNFPVIEGIQLAQGSWFSASDVSSGAKVAILGDMVASQLFGSTGISPVGQQIRIRDQVFRVIGVQSVQGGGFGSDDVIYVPLKTAQVRLKNTPTVDQIQVRVDAISSVNQVAQAITTTLRQNHHLSKNRVNDFDVATFTQFLHQANQGDQVLFFLLVAVAALSLTVGGIGIMNIMLVSVTERTWEIGIRMSIGARRRDIRHQFLIEALLLCLAGGVIGLLLGLLIGWALVGGFALPFIVTPTTLIVPFAVSAAIALIFGLYPAIRASRLDPIAAISAEQ
jgi:putative ABC transport system permease protein